MKKLERMREQKKLQQAEDRELARKQAAGTGQGFVDHELPPDEVDEAVVRRSLWHTVRSFIPFSNEYYEAMAAEDEMDDLKKIRIEKVPLSSPLLPSLPFAPALCSLRSPCCLKMLIAHHFCRSRPMTC